LPRLEGRRLCPHARPDRPGRSYVTAYTPHGGSFNYKPGGTEHKIYMAVERLLERATDMFLFESRFIAGRFEAYIGHMPRATIASC
jgi:hypothetical protein